MSSRAEKRQAFIDAIIATGKSQINTDDIRDIVAKTGLKWPQWYTKDESYRSVFLVLPMQHRLSICWHK